MTELTKAIEQALGHELSPDYDLVDVVAVPADDPAVQETLEYLVKLKAKEAPSGASAYDEGAEDSDQEVYVQGGKLNIPFLERNARILLQSGDYQLARNIYSTILQSGEDIASSYYGIGLTFLGEGKLEQAQKNLEESIAYRPDADAYSRLADIYERREKFADAAQVLDRALHLKSLIPTERAKVFKRMGDLWVKKNDPRLAEQNYLKALELAPRSDDLHSSLGSVFLQAGRIDDAERAFADSVELNPKNYKSYLGLGCCFLTLGDKKSAHDYFAKALDIELHNPTAIYYLVKCAYEIKSYKRAEQLVSQYVSQSPININLLYSLAGLQYHLDKYMDAKATIRKIFSVKPDHSGANELEELIAQHEL